MRLTAGTVAPAFATSDHLGHPIELNGARQNAVLLSFYRYASCPICNLRIHELTQAQPVLAELGLALIAVFQSPATTITDYVGKKPLPFPIIADPSMALYRDYGVESTWRGLFSWKVLTRALKAFASGYAPGRIDGPVDRVPADFLIDQQGRIAIAHYGRDIDDHLPLATIEAWLRARPATQAA